MTLTIKGKLICSISSLLMLFSSGCLAQKSNSIFFTPLISENSYVSNRRLYNLLIDSEGYLWAGTISGLIRFNGNTFTNYTKLDLGTGSSAISCLLLDSRSDVWIGTEAGLCRHDHLSGEFFPVNTKPDAKLRVDSKINCMREDPRTGKIWFSQKSKGMWSYDPKDGSFESFLYDPDSETIPLKIQSFVIDDNGEFILSTYFQGLFKSNSDFTSITPINLRGVDLSNDTVIGLSIYEHNTLYFVSAKFGLCECFMHSATAKIIVPLQSGESPNHLWVDNDGKPYMATNRGLHIYDPETSSETFFNSDNVSGLEYLNLLCAIGDNDGNILASSDDGNVYYGISKPFIKKFNYLSNGRSLDYSETYSFTEDESGNIWVLSKNLGILKYRPSDGQLERTDIGWIKGQCSYIHWHDGLLYVSSGASLYSFDPKSGAVTEFDSQEIGSSSLADRPIFPIRSIDGKLYLCTALGIVTFDPATKMFENLPGLEECNVNGIEKDGDFLWLSTYAHGLVKYDMNSRSIVGYENDADISMLTGTRVNCMCLDHCGRVWVGSSEDGMIVIQPDGKYTLLDMDNTFGALSSNIIKSIREDVSGTMWIATENGMTSISSSLDSFEHYSISNGLLNSSFVLRSSFLSSDGTLYFGSRDGFISFRGEKAVDTKHTVPGLYVESILVNGAKVRLSDELVLKYNQNDLTFMFARPDLPSSSDGYVSCMMEGIDKDWIRVGTTNEMSYKALKPGCYKLNIRSYNNNREIEVEHEPLSITIRRRLLFSIGAILIYCIVAAALLLLLAHKIIREFREREARRREECLKQQIASSPERKMLRAAQMGLPLYSVLSPDINEKDKKFISRIDSTIENCISDVNLSYGMIAQELCMGKQNLNLRFKKILGMTVNDYIRLSRLFISVRLLSQEESRVNEVCFNVGFNTPSYFTKCFKMTFGILPGDYRNL